MYEVAEKLSALDNWQKPTMTDAQYADYIEELPDFANWQKSAMTPAQYAFLPFVLLRRRLSSSTMPR